ncbi:hypothetical protein HNR06_004575 [Nocardiopsis arvandica]|uniref:Uncharacterized protein n=1 Tax=Nocardiopsis sinuspersici TaxID=501010 RepID=A0A7Y9XFS3_9ACTN|nr:hypothetical protein [Nocardiopsis sinuspersici]
MNKAYRIFPTKWSANFMVAVLRRVGLFKPGGYECGECVRSALTGFEKDFG